MLKTLSFWPNELSTTAEEEIYSLVFLSGNCWNLAADVFSYFFQTVKIFIHFPLNFLANKNHKVLIQENVGDKDCV